MDFRKIKFASLEGIERKIIHWIILRRHRLMFLVFIVLLLRVTEFIPYINLFFSPYLVVFMSLVLIPHILDLEPKIFFAVGIACFFLAAFLWFTGQVEEAEILTEYIFVILLSGSFKAFLSS